MEPTLLTSTRLLGKERIPGDKLSKEEWQQISPKVQDVLLRQKFITLDPKLKPQPTEQEIKATKTLQKAKTERDKAKALLHNIESQIEQRTKEKEGLIAQKEKTLLQAAKGDVKAQQERDKCRTLAATISIEVEDLHGTLKAAEEELRIAEAKVAHAERQRRQAEAQHIVNEQIDVAVAIERVVDTLAPLLREYRQNGARIIHLLEHGTGSSGGTQISSLWRIKSLLDRKLGLDYVNPSQRFDSLAEIETRVLNNALKRDAVLTDDEPPTPPQAA